MVEFVVVGFVEVEYKVLNVKQIIPSFYKKYANSLTNIVHLNTKTIMFDIQVPT